MYHLGRCLKEKAMNDSRPRNDGLRALTWQYSTEGQHAEPSDEEVLQSMVTLYQIASSFGTSKI
jgi:formate dehydrogenase major subunit